MKHFTDEDFTTALKTTQRGLSSLREEHCAIFKSLDTNNKIAVNNDISLPMEKSRQASENMDKLINGEDEASLMLIVSQLMRYGDDQHSKSQDYQRRLKQENACLVEELTNTHRKLQESEKCVGRLQEEVNHFRFMASIREYECDDQNQEVTETNSQIPIMDTLQELGLDNEEDIEDIDSYREHKHDAQSNSSTTPQAASKRIEMLSGMVLQYMKQGRYEIAGPLGKQALEDLISERGPDHLDVATMLNVLAMVYRDQEKYKEATNFLTRALQIREKHYGENHPYVAATLNNLAIIIGRRGRLDEAQTLCKRSLKIREAVYGKDSPDVAKQLNNLGLLCQNLGKYEEAEDYYKKALKIYEMKLDANHSETVKTRNHLSSLYMKQGNYKEAEGFYKQVLAKVYDGEPGNNNNNQKRPIWQIAEEREEKKQKGEVEEEYESGIFANLDSPTVQSTLKNLGELYRKQGKYEAAWTLEDVALRAKKQTEVLSLHSNSTTNSSNNESRDRMTASISPIGIGSKLLNVFGFKF
ncbi:hypothetical protein CRE_30752 [Caenorhabditis remanei]|uniref:Kinesin light chain n=1 Tax=Caenorhabditis remanei TaxID=31234 RepID=E3LU33_CAERE|nr:hypothetical protein CRE_30752 [Caenorhabditis remanei]